jgi:hypothetical protein
MDHSRTAFPHFSYKNKAVDSFMKLPVTVTRMITHGHRDVQYAYYGLDIYPSNLNHIVGSIAKLLRDLDSHLVYSTRRLFVGRGSSPLSQALLTEADMCEGSLIPLPTTPLLAALLQQILKI